MMQTSKLSCKGQITVPKELRKAIDIQAGDTVIYELEKETIKISKLTLSYTNYQEALSDTLEEWDSLEDEEAFNDL